LPAQPARHQAEHRCDSFHLVDEKGKIAAARYNIKAAHTTTSIDRLLGTS
jgi:hypothetical protein